MAIPSPQILTELREVAEMLQVINNMMLWRYNPDGTPDTTFGNGGIVVHDSTAGGSDYNFGSSLTTDLQERILVTGSSRNAAGDFDMMIWRYNPDGTVDTSFGNGGIVVSDCVAGENGNDYGYSIITDSLGRILVTGSSFNGSNSDMMLWRYNQDGTPDSGFGNGGIVVSDSAAGGNGDDEGYSIIRDLQGRILVTGCSRDTSGNFAMVIWRYNVNGTLDSNFGSNGIVVNSNATNGDSSIIGKSITLDSQGRILVAGNSKNASDDFAMVIWRFNPDGTPDATFGNGGKVVSGSAAGGNGYDYGNFITTDSQERILVTGWSRNTSDNFDMVVWRFNADGTLDTSFGNGGIVVSGGAAGGGSGDYGNSIATDSQVRILVTGSSFNGLNSAMVIWRYNPDGTLDTTFNSDGSTPGIVVHSSAAGGNSQDWGYFITTDSKGSILVTGCSLKASNDNDTVIRRYTL